MYLLLLLTEKTLRWWKGEQIFQLQHFKYQDNFLKYATNPNLWSVIYHFAKEYPYKSHQIAKKNVRKNF